ncbi:MAG: hypothetical protein BGO78_02855 [Chloroflexi bacterium 44-23]|nr:MAG: hypothetical protein BGO78_02855 [Chloroflexi bacterium 44-23]
MIFVLAVSIIEELKKYSCDTSPYRAPSKKIHKFLARKLLAPTLILVKGLGQAQSLLLPDSRFRKRQLLFVTHHVLSKKSTCMSGKDKTELGFF